jgi:hypothetical protein
MVINMAALLVLSIHVMLDYGEAGRSFLQVHKNVPRDLFAHVSNI